MTIVDSPTAVGPQTPSERPSRSKQRAESPLTEEELREFKRILLEMQYNILRDGFAPRESADLYKQLEDQGMLQPSPELYELDDDVCGEDVAIDGLEVEWTVLGEISAALERIRNGTYGLCEATGQPIALDTLRSQPWMRYCDAYRQSRAARRRSGR